MNCTKSQIKTTKCRDARRYDPSVLVGFVLLYLSFFCTFCRSLFVLVSFFFWPLYCLFFFDLRTLITSLWYLLSLLIVLCILLQIKKLSPSPLIMKINVAHVWPNSKGLPNEWRILYKPSSLQFARSPNT
jgi:hypothetical protein